MARFSVKGSQYAFEMLGRKTALSNARFREVTAVVVRITIFRVMTVGTTMTGVLAV
jgi:hypothetical protein